MRPKSQEIFRRSCKVTPGGVNSPVRSFKSVGIDPLVVESGFQDTLTDVDGNRYIDYCGSWGALIHGHAHPSIVDAASKRMRCSSSFGILTEIEAQIAELVVASVPWVEKVRFVSSGTEAAMSALRVARGFTGRECIVKFSGNYHGHYDSFLVNAGSGVSELPTSSSSGVCNAFIKNTLSLSYNSIDTCRKLLQERGKEIAAVILEPIAANMGLVVPDYDFLKMLREETEKTGALLIFDEVITGFRIALGGAAEYYGIAPDLCCFGKIIGGGFPAAAFGGPAEIMDILSPLGTVYQAGTLSGNPVAMAAGLQSISLCKEPDFYQTLERKRAIVTDPIQQLIKEKDLDISLQVAGSMFTLFFGKKIVRNFEDAKECDIKRFNHFFHTLFQKGIYLAPSQFETNFISSAHTTENLLFTRDCILETLWNLRKT